MTARRLPVLSCDGTWRDEPCTRTVWTLSATSIAALREAAARQNWVLHGRRDYCGNCAGNLPAEAGR